MIKNIVGELKFDERGLIPVVTQDNRTDEVLMVAYMNREAFEKSVETGMVHYWSRSRGKLWLKGETSGHFQRIRSISYDCDGDTLLIKVDQTGAACHTGHHSCFYRKLNIEDVQDGKCQAEAKPAENPCTFGQPCDDEQKGNLAEVLQEVYNTVTDRKIHPKEGSYTNYLFSKGLDKILKKVGEEASEVIIASKNGNPNEIKGEIADLLYHLCVLMVERGVKLDDIYEELKSRR
ncbi:bifunctional phosphoribosyl-AMP cyclohydrolase/phosphoribosyl-ATP diphosphatase [Clostridium thermosuccinogenes]|nr:bifunctional phosphoribosyl-AMP cyclohydrolase/phosphoribosyl-ATP diphosphatase [Pseudoclostridium thermosuccinogenes]